LWRTQPALSAAAKMLTILILGTVCPGASAPKRLQTISVQRHSDRLSERSSIISIWFLSIGDLSFSPIHRLACV
jgi:hypothetical protein